MFTVKSKPFSFVYSSPTTVQQDLAMTPSKMDEMRQAGIPITVQNLEQMYYDGSENASLDLPLDEVRGVDIATLWEESVSSAQKLSRRKQSKVDVDPSNTD